MRPIVTAAAALTLLAASTGLSAPAVGAGPTATYIVVLRPGTGDVDETAARLARRYDGRVGYVYEHALRGFSVEVPLSAAPALARSSQVAYVEADQVMSVVDQATPTGVARVFAPGNPNLDIDRLDDVRVDVDVAVIDTGIDLDHPDLNVVAATDCTYESGGRPWSRTVQCVAGGDDDHYHGTHVAGSAAALDNGVGVVGVAPGARLWAVKVLKASGSGTTAMVVAGINWVVGQGGIEVANLSLGGGFSQTLNDAVKGAVDAGVTMVVAAGNEGVDAATTSPASEPTAITVSALADFDGAPGGLASPTCRADQDDTIADFSNYGTVVDMIAPGVCIRSTYPGGSYATISGTSMAAPHVAGAAALLRSTGRTRADTESRLLASGNAGWSRAGDRDTVPEPLLDVSDTTLYAPALLAVGGGTAPANQPPTASFGSSCTELTCTVDATGSTDPDGTVASYRWEFGDGSTASGPTATHTYAAAGSYLVTLTVTDDDGATGTATGTVSASAPAGGGATFTGNATNQGSTWSAVVAASGVPAGQSVSGVWSIDDGSGSCTADAAGSCTIVRSGIAKRVASVTWTSAAGYQVTIAKP